MSHALLQRQVVLSCRYDSKMVSEHFILSVLLRILVVLSFYVLSSCISYIFFLSFSMSKDSSNIISINSYLYLHPNESPVVLLVSPILDINNYHLWYRSMTTTFIVKNKIEFVDGSSFETTNIKCKEGAITWWFLASFIWCRRPFFKAFFG